MRDQHRMKEKFDLSLDNRQIVSLLIAGLVVLGAVFVLGVVVGKKLAANPEAGRAPDLLAALDNKATAMDEMRKDASLTFQDTLTAQEPARQDPPPAPKVAIVEKKIDAPAEVKVEPKVETVPPPAEAVAKVEPKVEA